MIDVGRRVLSLVKYKLIDQWKFVYFEIDIRKTEWLHEDKQLFFRIAGAEDVEKIVTDIYPNLNGYGEGDGRYLEEPGDNLVFLCEKNSAIVHYWIVFENALDSPLVQTPIREKFIGERSAYLGSAFTVGSERGLWIIVHSVSHIIRYLKEKTDKERALLLVHRDTPGAIEFYRRLGFGILPNAAPKGVTRWLLEKLRKW